MGPDLRVRHPLRVCASRHVSDAASQSEALLGPPISPPRLRLFEPENSKMSSLENFSKFSKIRKNSKNRRDPPRTSEVPPEICPPKAPEPASAGAQAAVRARAASVASEPARAIDAPTRSSPSRASGEVIYPNCHPIFLAGPCKARPKISKILILIKFDQKLKKFSQKSTKKPIFGLPGPFRAGLGPKLGPIKPIIPGPGDLPRIS